ncbi:N-acetylneuraminate lyase [Aplysia californica]|uniref:N-acetylneuraminate lyase n=1 Tax=Aplysia californica TaxID=6500 RepID=A0ABM1A2Z9_APLCA|nr:N-acetylneuraminate lyase [Aplysia californica]
MGQVPEDFKITGAIAAPATALKSNGDVNPEAVADYVNFLANNEIDGVFVLGTLGEGLSLSVSERKEVAEAWVKEAKDKLSSVIVHVGAGNIRDSIELAQHAQKIGATAIACMLPSYFKPSTEAVAVEYIQQVAAAAPETPFYYYCINFMSGIYLNTAKILELASGRIPNLRGAKISSRELPSLLDSSRVCGGKLQIMVGTDEQFLPCLTLGIRVPVLNSFLGSLYKRLLKAFDAGDMDTARDEMVQARKLVLIRSKYIDGPAYVKAAMKCLGVDLGPVRLPLEDMPEHLLPSLKQDLKDLGLPVQ